MSNHASKVVVTGGAGFIGSHLAEKLLASGFEVHIIDNLSYGTKENIPLHAVFHEADIRDFTKLEDIFARIGTIDCLFHCAAIPMVQFSIDNPAEAHNVNVNGTMNILLASKNAGVKRIVYSASCSTYGDQETMPLTEDMLPAPKSPYAMQKYYGELACSVFHKVYGMSTISLRYFNVYGPKQDPARNYAMVIAKFIAQSKKGEPIVITGDGMQSRDFVFVDDVVKANILAMQNQQLGRGEVINIGSGIDTSILEIAKKVGGEIVYAPPRLEPRNARADISRAKALLGWEPTITLEQGIKILKGAQQQ